MNFIVFYAQCVTSKAASENLLKAVVQFCYNLRLACQREGEREWERYMDKGIMKSSLYRFISQTCHDIASIVGYAPIPLT